ncbi:energy transducer TonB [Lysobacter pythonis]|uniref:Protein TonB n=1 Tax=Solilutibacter pythonis TaxID=2483112 RepID=A0A3M2HWR9_9GAMM|nr:energy transducer TonB [Lysobacter pythonis]RMH93508.1 energy transducer TonB [Lysobacter pythonis]
MNAAAPPLPAPARLGERDRLGATLTLSAALHALVILGVGFVAIKPAQVAPVLDVMLTGARTPLTPKEAEFLAQASNQGGGEHEKSTRPTDDQSGRLPLPDAGIALQPLQAQSPRATPAPEARVITAADARDRVPLPQPHPQAEAEPLPPGPSKITRDMEMARLAAEIHLNSQRYAKRPKRRFVSASTREYAYAEYLRRWVERVERIGNLNYPEAARARNLAGQVVVSIGIRRDGSVESVTIVESSRQPILDQAALRIARLAQPYPALPKTDEEVDVLNVIRTWNFKPGGEFIDE